MPMGFYQPAQIVIDAQKHGVERLADADEFRSMGLDRRKTLWEVAALQDMPVEIFKGQPSESVLETQVELPLMTQGEHVVEDYASVGLSLKAHPVSFVRPQLEMLRSITTHAATNDTQNGQLIKVAGLVLVRQRPGTAKGVCFITIEDETGFTNLVLFQQLFDQYGKEILNSKLLMVEGKLQWEGLVVHVIVTKCFDLTKLLGKLVQRENDDLPLLTLARADEKSAPYPTQNKKTQTREDGSKEVFYGRRNFK